MTIKKEVFLLIHCYDYGEDAEFSEMKPLGVYSTNNNALEAIGHYYLLAGFNQHSRSCFVINKFELDKDQEWTEGFISSDVIATDFVLLTECFNQWLNMKISIEEAWADSLYYSALCEVDKIIHRSNDVYELANLIRQIWSKVPGVSKSETEYLPFAKKILEKLQRK